MKKFDQLFANNASTILTQDLPASGTAIRIQPGDESLFPTITPPDYFLVTIEDLTSRKWEICKVISVNGPVFSIVRSQEGSTQRMFPLGSKVELRVTKGSLEKLVQWAVDLNASFEHIQADPSDEWIIHHGLGKLPTILMMEADGTVIFGDIQFVDSDTVKIKFSEAISGKAIFN